MIDLTVACGAAPGWAASSTSMAGSLTGAAELWNSTGKKKKLKHSIATTDVTTAIQSRDVAATTRTTIKNVVDTTAAFDTCSHCTYMSVTIATAPRPAPSRPASDGPPLTVLGIWLVQRRKWKGTLVTTVFGWKRSAPLMRSAR